MNAQDEAAVISQQMPGNALARRAVPFQWQDVLLIAGPSSASDTVYELACILIAVAVWQQRRAVYLCQGGKAGTSSDAAIKVCSARSRPVRGDLHHMFGQSTMLSLMLLLVLISCLRDLDCSACCRLTISYGALAASTNLCRPNVYLSWPTSVCLQTAARRYAMLK